MRDLKDYLHPLWKDSLLNRDNSEDASLNKVILDTIDSQLKIVEDDTIKAKAQSFLDTASDEWLDYWGSWFGLKRADNQNDDNYREDIKNHVVHARDTIPALREAIANFLNTGIGSVNIYEPYKNIFILNASELNGVDHLKSDYYNYAIIDIQISVPFPPEVIDIINWFRPAGVIWVLTYAPGVGDSAKIWEMSPTNLEISYMLTELDIFTGFNSEYNASLTPNTKGNSAGYQGFWLNNDILNGLSLLNGDESLGREYYNYVGTLHGLINPKNSDTPESLIKQVDEIDPDLYKNLEDEDESNLAINITRKISAINLLPKTASFSGWIYRGGARLVNNKVTHGHAVVELPNTSSSICLSYAPYKLSKGKEYLISVSLSSDKPTDKVGIYADIDSTHKGIKVTDAIKKGTNTYSCSFVFDEGVMQTPNFYVKGAMANSGSVYISEIMLCSKELYTGKYSKCASDYIVPQNVEHQYVYAFFNFRKFFYENVQDYGNMLNGIGHNPTNQEINQYMSDYFNIRSYATSYKGVSLNGRNAHVQLMFYNFNLNTWVNYEDDNLSAIDKVQQRVNFHNIEPLLNDNGVFVVGYEINTLDPDYTVGFDLMGLGVTKYSDKGTSINIYATNDENYNWILTNLGKVNYLEDTSDRLDMYDRYQQHYPIRYIRNTIGNVNFAGDDSSQAKPFTLNNSLLNGNDYLSDYEDSSYNTDKDSYVDYLVTPKFNEVDKTIPIISTSILGAKISDKNHKNLLGNLLDGGIFTPKLVNNWIPLNDTTVEVTNNNVDSLAIHVFSDNSLKYQGVALTSQATYFETNYKVVFNAIGTVPASYIVKVILESNGYEVEAAQMPVKLTSSEQYFELPFNTNKVYPDNIKIIIEGEKPGMVDFYVSKMALKLDTTVWIDGKVVNRDAPELVPDELPMIYNNPHSYGDLNEGKVRWEDLLGNVTYDDIEFDDTNTLVNKGTSPKIPQGLLELQQLAVKMKLENDPAYDNYRSSLDSAIKYLSATGRVGLVKEHTITVDLGSVHTDISSLLVHHGSDSNQNAMYDSLVQTSVDGVHWHTWYDNFKGTKDIVDPHYIEPVGRPKEIEVPVYNVFQDKVDLGKPDYYERVIGHDYTKYSYEYSEALKDGLTYGDIKKQPMYIEISSDDNETEYEFVPDDHSMSAVAERYPAYDLLDLIGSPTKSTKYVVDTQNWLNNTKIQGFQELWELLNSGITDISKLGQAIKDYANSTYGNIFPTLQNNRVYSPYEYLLAIQEYLNDLNNLITTTTTTTTETTLNPDTIPGLLKTPVLYSQVLKHKIPYGVFNTLGTKWSDIIYDLPTTTTTSTTTSTSTTTTTTTLKPPTVDPRWFLTGDHNSTLNSSVNVLADGSNMGSILPPVLIPGDNGSLVTTSTTRPPIPITTTTTINPADMFILNDEHSLMNSKKVLADGTIIPDDKDIPRIPDEDNPNKGTIPVDPSKYLQQNLVEVNMVEVFENDSGYKTLFDRLNITERSDKISFIRDVLVGYDTEPVFYLDVVANSKVPWTVSLWDSYYNRGVWRNTEGSNTSGRITLTANSLLEAMDSSGIVYAMVTAQTSESAKEVLNVTSAQMRVVTRPQAIRDYRGGLYPHFNLALGTSKTKLFKGNSRVQEFPLYEVEPNIAGRTVRLSFNLDSSSGGGYFYIYSKELGNIVLPKRLIEANNQHFSFIVNIPKVISKKPSFYIHFEDTIAFNKLHGFKVELGSSESPYILNVEETTTTTTTIKPSGRLTYGDANYSNTLYKNLKESQEKYISLKGVVEEHEGLSDNVTPISTITINNFVYRNEEQREDESIKISDSTISGAYSYLIDYQVKPVQDNNGIWVNPIKYRFSYYNGDINIYPLNYPHSIPIDFSKGIKTIDIYYN